MTESLQYTPEILQQFQDLLETDEVLRDQYEEKYNHVNKHDSDEEDTIIPVLCASNLNSVDFMYELNRLNIQPKGFFEDDCKALQVALDKEHNDYIESKKRDKQIAQDLEESQASIQRIKLFTELAMEEEEIEIKKNRRVRDWIELIHIKQIPSICRMHLNDISTRSISRHLWSDHSLVSLDMTNCQITDRGGVYIARVLKQNTSIKTLELGDNLIGFKTCVILADSLKTNHTLTFLGLDSNPLTSKNVTDAVESLSSIIMQNSSLHHLSLYRCNIGVGGGRAIANAISTNDNLCCLEFEYNYWEHDDVDKILKKLVRCSQSIIEKMSFSLELICVLVCFSLEGESTKI